MAIRQMLFGIVFLATSSVVVAQTTETNTSKKDSETVDFAAAHSSSK
jgi:hypothetical protein